MSTSDSDNTYGWHDQGISWAEIGSVDPTSLVSYRKAGGYAGLKRAVEKLGAEGTVNEIAAAGLRGRGGGGYPTAQKWRAARGVEGENRYTPGL